MRKVILLTLAFILFVPAVLGTEYPNFTIADGGNVTEVTIRIEINSTLHWQGYSGLIFYGTNASSPKIMNATGSFVNRSEFFIQTNCSSPTSVSGFIFASNSTSAIASPVAGNLTLLDHILGDPIENATKTFFDRTSFALSTGTVANVPTTYLYVNETGQKSSFRQGYFNQGNDLIFATIVENNLMGYNETYFDYQLLLPAVNQTVVPYYISLDITFTCPAAPPPGQGGGGGASGGRIVRCKPLWNCTTWGPCGSRNLQFRFCKEMNNCEKRGPEPPAMRLCMAGLFERPEVISGKIITEELLKNILLQMNPAKGDILDLTALSGTLANNNVISVEDINIKVETPDILVYAMPAHPYRKLFWNNRIGAWSDHGTPKPKTLDWSVGELPEFERINPKQTLPISFDLVPPLLKPTKTVVGVHAFSGPHRIASVAVPFTVEIPIFDVYTIENERNVLTVYYLVDNRGNKAQKIDIELAFNKNRNTFAAELIGPLHVPEDFVAIFAYEYKLNNAMLDADIINAKLFAKEKTYNVQKRLR